MFKTKKIALVGLSMAALIGGSLVGCGSETVEPEFEQNTSVQTEGFKLAVVGSQWKNWNPKEAFESADLNFTKQSSGLFTYTVTITSEIASGWWGFKFVGQADWNPAQYGLEDIDFDSCNAAFKKLVTDKNSDVTDATSYYAKFKGGSSNRTNISSDALDSKAGAFDITYNPANFWSDEDGHSHKIVVNFTAAA